MVNAESDTVPQYLVLVRPQPWEGYSCVTDMQGEGGTERTPALPNGGLHQGQTCFGQKWLAALALTIFGLLLVREQE